MNNVGKVIDDLLNIPNHKLVYVIRNQSLVKGMVDTFKHYGIEYTKEIHEQLVEAVQEKLEGPDMEREWTEEEYTNFVCYV